MNNPQEVFDLSIVFTQPPPDSPSEILAHVAFECDTLGLNHTGEVFTDPLTEAERDDLRWYLEEYWKWPYLEFADRGRQIEALLSNIGKRLYHVVFGSVRAQDIVEKWWKQVNVQQQISIVSEIPSVLSLPWELLHNQQGFLALHPDHPIPIIRRFSQPEQAPLLTPFEPPLRILLITTRPTGGGFIDPRSLAHELLNGVQQYISAGSIELEFLRPPTRSALRTRLQKRQKPIHVLHFDGHGIFNEQKKQGMLAFEDSKNKLDPVTATELAQLLHNSNVQLVVLTACQSAASAADDAFSSVAAQLLQGGINTVVAMSASILVASATRFAEAFYRALASGVPTSLAQEQARQTLHDDPRRHVTRHYRNEEGKPVELHDWWLFHFYQRHPVALRPGPIKSQREYKEQQQNLVPLDLLSEEVPAEPPYGFNGRAHDLLQIERWLLQGKLVVIHGFGGIGKTAIAREAAHWLTRTAMYDEAYFLSFERGGNAARLLSALGNSLGVYDGNYDPTDYMATLVQFRPILKDRRILLIADNLESILPGGETPLVSMRLIQLWDVLLELAKLGAGVLLTSRNTNFSDERFNRASNVAHLHLHGLDPEDAYAFATCLLDGLGIDREHAPYAELVNLLTQLDYHPLSIQLVLPTLRERSLTTISEKFTELLPTFAQGLKTGRNQSLLASLNYSLQHLSNEQQRLLQRFVLFEGGTNEDALLQITEVSEEEWSTLRAMMEQTALLTVQQYKDISVPFLHFHPILIPFLRSDVDANNMTLNERYISYYRTLAQQLQSLDRRHPLAARKLARLEIFNLQHTLALLNRESNIEDTFVMALRIAYFLKVFGWEQDELGQKAVSLSHPTANALAATEFIREIYQCNNEIEKGRLLTAHTHLLALLERIEAQHEGAPYGRGSYAHSKTLTELAHCLIDSGNFIAAEDYARQALALIERLIQQDHTQEAFVEDQGHILLYLGTSLRDQGLYPQAETAYEQARQVFQQIDDLRSQDIALTNLGTLALMLQNYPKAQSYYLQALKIDKILGESGMEAVTWHYLGLVAEEQKEWSEAERCYRACLMLREQSGDKVGTASVCNNLAILAERTNRYIEAENWLKRALNLDEQVQPNSYSHARSLQNFATLLLHEIQARQAPITRLDEAKRYAERVLTIIETHDTPMIWHTFSILKSMAELEENQEAAQDYSHHERETYIAYEGNRHLVNDQGGTFIVCTLATIMGNMQAMEVVVALAKRLGDTGMALVKAIKSILEGQKNWEVFVGNLNGFYTLHLIRVLEILAEPMSIIELLPRVIRKPLEDGNMSAFKDIFAHISPEEQQKVTLAVVFLYLSFQEGEHSLNVSDLALNFESIAAWFE